MISSNVIILHELLPLLSKERVDTLPYWLDVAQVIFNILNLEGKTLFDEFSIARGKTKEECDAVYPEIANSKLTIRTIAFFARKDSPDEYSTWHVGHINQSILDQSNYDETIHQVLKMYLWLDIVVVGEKLDLYIFDGATLMRDHDYLQFKKIVYDSVDKLFKGDRFYWFRNKLDSDYYLESLTRFLVDWFKVDATLDSDLNKIACKNGVLQCINDELIFVDGKPEDYISNKIKIKFTRNSKKEAEVMEYFKSVFLSPDILHETLKILSSYLDKPNGKNTTQVVGEFNSGKTKLCKVIKCIYEDRVAINHAEEIFYLNHSKSHYISVSNKLRNDGERRILYIPFTRRFSIEDYFDTSKLSLSAVLGILVDYYPIYKREGLNSMDEIASQYIIDTEKDL